MYKLIIVDDELLIREGLARDIDWASLGFTVCCTASSGEEAYALAVAHRPDALITDISMANMDGIALMKKLRKDGFTLPIVIISGYDDFKYAQQAIKYGAVEYLLKPIHEADLRSLFASIRRQLDADRSARGPKPAPAMSAATRNALWRSVLMMYLEGQTTAEDALFHLVEPEPMQPDRPCALAVLSAEPAVLSALERAASHHAWACRCRALLRQDLLMLLFFGGDEVTPALDAFLRAQPAAVRGAAVYCILERAAFGALPGLYRRIMATPYRFFYLTPWTISSLDDALCAGSEFPLPAASLLLEQLRGGNPAEFPASVAALTARLRRERPNPDTAAIQLSELYSRLAGLLRERGRAVPALSFQELYCALCDCPNAVRFTEVFRQRMDELADAACAADQARPSVVADIQRYLDAHYAEDLSLSSLAKRFYLSQAYLSGLFSKRMGITFSDYLEKVRMEHAAALLRTTYQNISEVSAAVGYKNARYFCRLFKNYYACTPTEYRRRSLEAQP